MSKIFSSPENTRLVTIVAHVDHGKTTLADSLCEHNGIISERLAGTIRYLDSMEEEQRRGITIRSSAIALKHSYTTNKRNVPGQAQVPQMNKTKNNNMLIHLIDSPGHVDFAMEVSSALQICDGAILVVDIVEGMCARTQSILREAYSQRLVPILVLNKMDRLCTDLGLTVNEAYVRIRNVVESINAAASSMIRSARAQAMEVEDVCDGDDTGNVSTATASDVLEQDLEMIWNFDPVKGNVVFTSALYGWGFAVPYLARSLFQSKLIPSIKPPILRQYLFGDFKYRKEDGKVLKWKQNDDQHTMFAQYGLEPLWDIITGVSKAQTSLGQESTLFGTSNKYEKEQSHDDKNGDGQVAVSTKIKATTNGMADIVMDALQVGSTTSPTAMQSLKVPTTLQDMQHILDKSNASSEETILRALLRRHRPLSDAVLNAVCEICPSPVEASTKIRKHILSLQRPDDDKSMEDGMSEYVKIQNSVSQCLVNTVNNTMEPTVAHCCKFVSTDRIHVNDPELFSQLDNATSGGSDDNDGKPTNIILGIARVLCGTLCSKDVEYYCFGPKFKQSLEENVPKCRIRLYVLMGSSYLKVDQVPAGHICAVYGLEEMQLKYVTLCSSRHGMPLRSVKLGLRPLVKVNVEAMSNSDTAALERGLAKLSLADAAVEVIATTKGERILACLGEIHLEQSILDLRNEYIGRDIELRISKPIVEFRESTTWFENELDDFEHFYNQESVPLRQTMIPPYCEEDGLQHAKNGRSRTIVSGRGMALHVRVLPLSAEVHTCLKNNTFHEKCCKDLVRLGKALNIKSSSPNDIFDTLLVMLASIDSHGNAFLESEGVQNGFCVKGVVCRPKEPKEVYMPKTAHDKNAGTEDANEVESNKDCFQQEQSIKIDLAKADYEEMKSRICGRHTQDETLLKDSKTFRIWKDEFRGSLVGGFQSGCAAGPLCEEPIRGIVVVLEGIEMAMYERRKKTGTEEDYKIAHPITGGMVIAALRTGIRTALLTRPARLMEGHLKLTLHSSLSALGPLYDVLSKRRGRVITDAMVEGTDLISIEATLPQSESFGLTSELMKKSSGQVTAPELVFSHWEVLDEDPFWIPTSLEEREDYGEIVLNGDISTGIANTALRFIRLIRERKGLIVDSHKIVVAAEKQRTLARKK